MAETVEAVIAHAGPPVHLVGHSFGGCVAMAVAVRGRVALSGLTMFEANPVDVLRVAGEGALHALAAGMLAAYRAAPDDPAPVAARVIDFWGGAGSHDALPAAVQDYIARTAATNARDWRSALDFVAGPDAYRAVACPATFVHGSAGHPAARRMCEILAGWLPRGRVAAVAGASHFMISTHPAETAALIARDLG
jgi:pimeloyl-ACP methyl ester carboxylesterase